MRKLPLLVTLVASSLVVAACAEPQPLALPEPGEGAGGAAGQPGGGGDGGGGPGGAGGTGGAGGAAGAGGAGPESCSATLTWLQKDAYRSTAGRTSALWPPHTTTTLEVTCDGTQVSSQFRENHGTLPDALDANGDRFLVEMGSQVVPGTRAELAMLAELYAGCECATSFLSLDALGDAAVQQLVAEVSGYVTSHLTCTGALDAAGLVGLLQAGDVEAVLGALPDCSWEAGSGWDGGLDAALLAVIAAAGETLADYHVCNNDAALQTALVETFSAGGGLLACDGALPICHGPTWFFEP